MHTCTTSSSRHLSAYTSCQSWKEANVRRIILVLALLLVLATPAAAQTPDPVQNQVASMQAGDGIGTLRPGPGPWCK